MKKIFLVMLLATANQEPARADGGGGFAGATLPMQITQLLQLQDSYVQQGFQLTSELNREQIMIKNALMNPSSVTLSDLRRIAADTGRLQSAGASIGNSMAQVDANFAARFKSPTAQTYSDKFKAANDGSMAAIHESMQVAGLHRENFQSDTDAVVAMTTKLQASQGTNDALMALGSINAAQLNDSIKTRELLSSQQLATNNWMAAQTTKEKINEDMNNNIGSSIPMPKLTTPNPKNKI